MFENDIDEQAARLMLETAEKMKARLRETEGLPAEALADALRQIDDGVQQAIRTFRRELGGGFEH